MSQMAEGHVWQFHVSFDAFDQVQKDFLVIHHIRDGDKIRVHCLSETKPYEHAEVVKASLEDAYLWLQRG